MGNMQDLIVCQVLGCKQKGLVLVLQNKRDRMPLSVCPPSVRLSPRVLSERLSSGPIGVDGLSGIILGTRYLYPLVT